MSAAAVKAGSAFVEIGTRQGLFDKGLAAVRMKLSNLTTFAAGLGKTIGAPVAAIGDGMGKFGSGAMKAGATIAGVGAAGAASLAALTQSFADAGSAIDDMAQRTGLSTDAVQRLAYAAKMSGADIADVEKAVRTMGKSLSEARNGNKEAATMFARLGLSLSQLSSLSPDKQFAAIADAVRKIRDPGERAAMAMQVFGKSGAALVPMLTAGKQGIQDLMSEADALGVVMGEKDVAAAAALGDKLDQFWTVARSVANTIGASLAPVMIELGDTLIAGLQVVRKFIADFAPFAPLALKIAAGVAVAGAALVAIGATMAALGAAITGAITVAATLGTVLAGTFAAILSPIGLVVASIAAMGAAMVYYTGTGSTALASLQAAWSKFSSWVAPIIDGVKNALMSGEWAKAGEILMLSLEIAFREGVASLYAIWTDLQTSILNAWTDLPVGIMNGFDTMAANLRNVWGAVVVNLQNAFSTVITWLRGTWDRTVNTIAKKLLYLYSLIDRSVDYEAAAKQMDKEADQRAAQRQQELTQTTEGRRAAMEKAAATNLAASDARNTARTDAATATKDQRTAAAATSKEAFTNKTASLQTSLASLVASVKPPEQKGSSMPGLMAMFQATPIGALTTSLGKMAMDAYAKIPAAGPAAAQTASGAPMVASGGIAGTFSSFAAGMAGNASPFGGLVDTSKKQLTELQKITANTKAMGDPSKLT